MKVTTKLAVLSALTWCIASTLACRPPLDGGWDGNADCGQNNFPLDAIFDENGDAELHGTIFIENIFGGLTAKGVIDNGERNDDGSYDGDLQTDDDNTPEFQFDFEFDNDDIDTVRGNVDVLDNNGQSTDKCDLKLERVTLNN